ncbi:MAG: LysR family transcriptional regulator, partial [Caulobacteraceae bacterium]
LASFHARHPGIRIDVAIGNTRDVAQAVIDGRAELGLVEGEVDEAVLTRTVLDHDELVLVVAADHPMAQDGAGPPDLKTLSWVLREPGSGTRSAFEAALAERGLTVEDLDVAMTLPGNEAVASAVAARAGATVMSRTVVAARLRSGVLACLSLSLPARSFWLLRHKQRYRSKAGQTFLDMLKS